MKRALFGGTFDPPHLGHTYLAEAAVQAVGLEEVVFIPCHQSPHKTQLPVASDADRLTMLRLATADSPWARVSDWELLRPEWSYSWETAEYFAALTPGEPLFWILGADQWASLPCWSRPERLAELLTFLVINRSGVDFRKEAQPPFRAIFLEGQRLASSSEVRQRLLRGENVRGDLHAEVADFICRRDLYQTGGSEF